MLDDAQAEALKFVIWAMPLEISPERLMNKFMYNLYEWHTDRGYRFTKAYEQQDLDKALNAANFHMENSSTGIAPQLREVILERDTTEPVTAYRRSKMRALWEYIIARKFNVLKE